jgi:lactoylglutathione lyase/methylmalonyl-CoA/ethylmalonyl-CoA epimerase
MIKKVDHIGSAVHSIEKAREPYEAIGLVVTRIVDVPTRPLRVAFLPVGDADVELLEPTSADSDVARYLKECGEGIHHICFEVDDVDAAVAAAKAKGMRLVDEVPRQGASGRIAFLHPSSTHGVRIEFVEKQ